jgi:uncharacterized protein YlxP (DUF503 family)
LLKQSVPWNLHKPMYIGALIFEIFISESTSLKDKRMILNSIKDRLRKKFNVAVSELDYQDKWQRSEMGIVTIANEYTMVEKSLHKIFSILDSSNDYEIIKHRFDYM